MSIKGAKKGCNQKVKVIIKAIGSTLLKGYIQQEKDFNNCQIDIIMKKK